jgi:hypothetical protein
LTWSIADQDPLTENPDGTAALTERDESRSDGVALRVFFLGFVPLRRVTVVMIGDVVLGLHQVLLQLYLGVTAAPGGVP